MKKTILLAIAATLALTTFAQTKKDVNDSTMKLEPFAKVLPSKGGGSQPMLMMATRDGKVSVNAHPESDTLRINAAGMLAIQDGDKFVYLDAGVVREIAKQYKQGSVALVVPLQWIVANYQYLDNSNGGLSKKQVEELQQPLAQYYQYYMYVMQQQRQQSQQKN